MSCDSNTHPKAIRHSILLNICCRKTKKFQIITQFIIPQNVVLSTQRKLPEKNFENGDRERKKKRNVNDRRVFFTVCIQNWCAVGEKERTRDTMTLYNNANYFNWATGGSLLLLFFFLPGACVYTTRESLVVFQTSTRSVPYCFRSVHQTLQQLFVLYFSFLLVSLQLLS